MTICVLDAAPYQHGAAAAARRAVASLAADRGAAAQTFFLPDIPIADCAGDFKCWTQTPGQCAIGDANREIARAMMQSEVLVLLTPVTFGGYASDLKKAVDHLIPNISPFFTTLAGETHHEKRYDRYPALVGVGLMEGPDAEAERVFRTIVTRNAVNMQSERYASTVVHRGMGSDGIAAEAARVLEAACGTGRGDVGTAAGAGEGGAAGPARRAAERDEGAVEFGPRRAAAGAPSGAPRSALLLGGSPRGERSSSTALGSYLLAQLASRGLSTESLQIYAAQRSAAGIDALLAASDRADLVVLAFPLYVDSLPAGVIRMLERIAAHRQARAARDASGRGAQRLTAMVQCGFPEARHNHTALAVCRQFARQAGFDWAGGLPLGGGHGLVQATPIDRLGGKAAFVRRALDMTAASLAAGSDIPDEAVVLMSRRFVPAWLYRLFGNVGWRLDARRSGAARRLRDRPYIRASS